MQTIFISDTYILLFHSKFTENNGIEPFQAACLNRSLLIYYRSRRIISKNFQSDIIATGVGICRLKNITQNPVFDGRDN